MVLKEIKIFIKIQVILNYSNRYKSKVIINHRIQPWLKVLLLNQEKWVKEENGWFKNNKNKMNILLLNHKKLQKPCQKQALNKRF